MGCDETTFAWDLGMAVCDGKSRDVSVLHWGVWGLLFSREWFAEIGGYKGTRLITHTPPPPISYAGRVLVCVCVCVPTQQQQQNSLRLTLISHALPEVLPTAEGGREAFLRWTRVHRVRGVGRVVGCGVVWEKMPWPGWS